MTELGTPIIRELDELRLTTKLVLRLLEIDTVPRRVVVFTDTLNETGTGVGCAWTKKNACCATNGVAVGVAVGVNVGVGVFVAIFTMTLRTAFTTGKGVATCTNGIGVRVGVGVPTLPDGDTTIVNDLRLIWVMPPEDVVTTYVIVTDVGCDTASSRISIHQNVKPSNDKERLLPPVPVTLQSLFA